ncbi:MAG: hypothetical protein IPF58_05800 [Saprospirales bacterium]|nr:hypothetical protein [Saprospirales bacterium]
MPGSVTTGVSTFGITFLQSTISNAGDENGSGSFVSGQPSLSLSKVTPCASTA